MVLGASSGGCGVVGAEWEEVGMIMRGGNNGEERVNDERRGL